MANLTLAIDEDLLRRARVRAAEQGTSVNAVVRQLIEGYSSSDRAENAVSYTHLTLPTKA